MARLPSAFNASESEKLGDFTPIDAGVYPAQIVKSEMKPTQSGDGAYLQLEFEVLEGQFVGRKLWARLNLTNKNPVTVEIAQKTLATICECLEVEILEDSEQLHGKPMLINVIVKPAQAQYAAQNDIKGYSKYDGAAPVNPTVAKPEAAPGNGSGSKNPPWKK